MTPMMYLMLGLAVLLGLVLTVRFYRVKHHTRATRKSPGYIAGDASSSGGEPFHSHTHGSGHDLSGGDGGGHGGH